MTQHIVSAFNPPHPSTLPSLVSMLGLRARKLTWKPPIEFITAHRAYVAIYHRYKNARYIRAAWVPTTMEAYVLSKMSFMASRAPCSSEDDIRCCFGLMSRKASSGSFPLRFDIENIR